VCMCVCTYVCMLFLCTIMNVVKKSGGIVGGGGTIKSIPI